MAACRGQPAFAQDGSNAAIVSGRRARHSPTEYFARADTHSRSSPRGRRRRRHAGAKRRGRPEDRTGAASAADRTWDYAVAREPFEGDLVIEAGPARVFVDPDAAQQLEQAVLDAHVDDDTLETRFVVRTS